MAVLRPLTRLVYFRISEEEFTALRQFCGTDDSRSISALARNAVRAMIEAREMKKTVDVDGVIVRLDENVEALRVRLQRIEELLARMPGLSESKEGISSRRQRGQTA